MVILTGAGEKAFVSGADIGEIPASNAILPGVTADPFGGADPPPLKAGEEAVFRVNPAQVLALRPQGRRVESVNGAEDGDP